ncbi:MAG: penicillin amidase [Blastocatellia bacterium]|jgi:penicillin amidase|nr:penicillin amidase [Blastocatellia bacterium]
MKKRLAACSLALLTIFQTLALSPARVAAQQATTATTAATATTLRLAGLTSNVVVRRDERGIAYIEAANESDLFMAQGYVTASDRLFQMELFRRTARGELSEIFGNTTIDEDKRHRNFGFAQLAEAQLMQAPAKLRRALEDYARGVNAYIESRDANSLPPEFKILQFKPRPWSPADSLVVSKLFDESLSTTWQLDMTRAAFHDLPQAKFDALFPETSPLDVLLVGQDNAGAKKSANQEPNVRDHQAVRASVGALTMQAAADDEALRLRSLGRLGLYAKDSAASNNWVVSGKHTETGQPLLANDPHLQPSAPSIWYMVHLSAPGLRAAGVSVSGLPGIAIGHNEHIAWGVTSLEADVQDLYVEKFDAQNPRRYQTSEGWREADIRREEIKVRKGFMSAETETIPYEVTVTRHGPIILEREGKRYALRWTALEKDANLSNAFYAINYARNWQEFSAAFKDYAGPAFNMVYADTKGHIGYYGVGRFPIRKSGDGKLPYDGATDEGEWTGVIPFAALPHLYDPPNGLIVTANSRIVGRSYPYKLTVAPLAAYRARRIYELLQAKPKLTIQDFRAIQGDTLAIAGVTFAAFFVNELTPTVQAGSDDKLLEHIKLLKEWDGRVLPESRAALLVAHLRSAFRRRILAGALGEERAKLYAYSNADTFVDSLIKEKPAGWLPKEQKSYAELLRAANDDSVKELTKSYGADETKWTWSREALVRFTHPLAQVPLIGQQFIIAPFPQNGSTNSLTTINRGSNVSMRLIADPSDWDRTQQGIALGVSGVPSSPHWQDQLDDWRNVTPRVFPFTKAAVAAAAKETLTLEPATR